MGGQHSLRLQGVGRREVGGGGGGLGGAGGSQMIMAAGCLRKSFTGWTETSAAGPSGPEPLLAAHSRGDDFLFMQRLSDLFTSFQVDR